jgi:hypothetical protein
MSLKERVTKALRDRIPVSKAFTEDELKALVGLGLCVEFQGQGKHIGVKPSVRHQILGLNREYFKWQQRWDGE